MRGRQAIGVAVLSLCLGAAATGATPSLSLTVTVPLPELSAWTFELGVGLAHGSDQYTVNAEAGVCLGLAVLGGSLEVFRPLSPFLCAEGAVSIFGPVDAIARLELTHVMGVSIFAAGVGIRGTGTVAERTEWQADAAALAYVYSGQMRLLDAATGELEEDVTRLTTISLKAVSRIGVAYQFSDMLSLRQNVVLSIDEAGMLGSTAQTRLRLGGV